MRGSKGRRERPALDAQRLDELALAYVGRFATTRANLAAYLKRKLRERGWAGERPPGLESIVERLTRLGYVDDAAYALAKSRSLSARGYGERRLGDALRAAGIADEDAAEAREAARQQAVEAALRFARRRRIGPYADVEPQRAEREKALAAMVRAGHDFALAKAILAMQPGSDPESLESDGRYA